MFKTNKKEQFSIAYVCALAAQLGFNHFDPVVDDESVDIEFIGNYSRSDPTIKTWNPHLEVQLKCTKNGPQADNYLHFSLPVKNYNDLREVRRSSPAYLIVLHVPDNEDDWIIENTTDITLKYNAYWFSLKDYPDTNNKTSVTVKIPVINRLTKDSFKNLMDNSSKGIAL